MDILMNELRKQRLIEAGTKPSAHGLRAAFNTRFNGCVISRFRPMTSTGYATKNHGSVLGHDDLVALPVVVVIKPRPSYGYRKRLDIKCDVGIQHVLAGRRAWRAEG